MISVDAGATIRIQPFKDSRQKRVNEQCRPGPGRAARVQVGARSPAYLINPIPIQTVRARRKDTERRRCAAKTRRWWVWCRCRRGTAPNRAEQRSFWFVVSIQEQESPGSRPSGRDTQGGQVRGTWTRENLAAARLHLTCRE